MGFLFAVTLFSGLFAPIIGLLSWFGLWWNRHGRRHALSIAEMDVTRAAAHAGDDYVALWGKVVPSEQGTFESPLGQREVVGFRAWTLRRGYRTNVTERELELRFRPFFLDDGSGARARIECHRPRVIGRGARVHRTRVQTTEQDRYVLEHDPYWRADARTYEAYEVPVCPGDTVFVVGSATSGEPRSGDGYREAPRHELVVRASTLSLRSPQETVRFLDAGHRQARYGLISAAISLIVFSLALPAFVILNGN